MFGSSGCLLDPELHHQADLAVAQRGCLRRLDARPGDAHHAGDLAALHRQHALLGPLIALDLLNLVSRIALAIVG